MELKAEFKQLGVRTGRVVCATEVDQKGIELFDSLGDKREKQVITNLGNIEEVLRKTSLQGLRGEWLSGRDDN